MAAIYMWFEDEEVIVTTTPYPIEIVEGMHLGYSLLDIRMDPVPEDAYIMDVTARDGSVVDILLIAPVEDDAYIMDVTALDGTVADILIIAPVEDDAYIMDVTALDGTIRDAIVDSWMPDEGIHFGCTLLDISMTAV